MSEFLSAILFALVFTRGRIPSAFPEGPNGPIEVKVISGKSFGVESPVKHLGGCWYMDFQFKASDVTVFQDLRKLSNVRKTIDE